jgi:hypothetical protein
MLWANGTAYDDVEEGECMRTQCTTLKYVHHCCNSPTTKNDDALFLFSNTNAATSYPLRASRVHVRADNHNDDGVEREEPSPSEWRVVTFGRATYKQAGPRERPLCDRQQLLVYQSLHVVCSMALPGLVCRTPPSLSLSLSLFLSLLGVLYYAIKLEQCLYLVTPFFCVDEGEGGKGLSPVARSLIFEYNQFIRRNKQDF